MGVIILGHTHDVPPLKYTKITDVYDKNGYIGNVMASSISEDELLRIFKDSKSIETLEIETLEIETLEIEKSK